MNQRLVDLLGRAPGDEGARAELLSLAGEPRVVALAGLRGVFELGDDVPLWKVAGTEIELLGRVYRLWSGEAQSVALTPHGLVGIFGERGAAICAAADGRALVESVRRGPAHGHHEVPWLGVSLGHGAFFGDAGEALALGAEAARIRQLLTLALSGGAVLVTDAFSRGLPWPLGFGWSRGRPSAVVPFGFGQVEDLRPPRSA